MTQAINQSRREKNSTALLFVDLDGFKAVNDSFGHDSGDHVLVTIARRLQSCVRINDTVARIGGDEFLIILNGLKEGESAAKVATKIIASVREPLFIMGNELNIGASIGISLYPEDGGDVETLIKEADKAMYRIKRGDIDSVHLSNIVLK